MRPSLCLINYNGEAHLRKSLQAAVAQAEHFEEIMMVDNGSTDGSLDSVRRHFPMVRLVCMGANGGAGGARNAGIRAAASDLILFLDNDVILLEGCAARLVEALHAYPDAIVAAPSVIYAKAPDLIQYSGADNHFLGLMILGSENTPVAECDRHIRKTNSVVTACFLLDRSRLFDDEPFDDLYFYQMEDHDFGVRLRGLGHEILAVPQAQVLHGEGAEGLSIRQMGTYSSMRVFCLIRNRWLFLLKHYSVRSLLLLLPALLVYECAQLVIVCKNGWVRQWVQALLWVVVKFPTIRTKRAVVQRTRKEPDRAFLTGGPLPFRQELTNGWLERRGKAALDAIIAGYWRRVEHLI